MANEVDIDEEALRAQAAALDVGAEAGEAADGAGPEPEVILDDVARAERMARGAAPVIAKLLRSAAGVAVPNWQITHAQFDELGQSAAFALALWFPHEIPPKWAALLGVGMGVWAIAESNRDPDTGDLRPRFKPRPDADAASA